MEYAGERRWLFLSQCVATSIRPYVGSALVLFPEPDGRWQVQGRGPQEVRPEGLAEGPPYPPMPFEPPAHP